MPKEKKGGSNPIEHGIETRNNYINNLNLGGNKKFTK